MKHQVKAIIRYRIHTVKHTFLITALSLCALYLIALVAAQFFSAPTRNFTMNGIELVFVVTAFVVGLCSFKDEFLFFSVNGVSRKTQILGSTAAFFSISAMVSVLTTIMDVLFTLFCGKLQYCSMFYALYWGKPFSNLSLSGVMEEAGLVQTLDFGIVFGALPWRMCLCFFFLILGYFISCAYFRMNKALKIAVSIGFPLVFLYLLPALDYFVLGNRLLYWLRDFFLFFLGYPFTHNWFLLSCLCFFCAGLLFFGLSALLSRRAPVRK